jgi:hypothetical protein
VRARWARIPGRAALLLSLVSCAPTRQSEQPCPVAQPSMPAAPSAPASDTPEAGDLTVASAVGPGDSYSFSVGPCTGTEPVRWCSFGIRLLRGQRSLGVLPLDPVWSNEVVRLTPSDVPGLGDSLGQPTHWTTWGLGRGESQQAMGATLVRLGPHHEGVLLRRVHGGEARDILVIRNGTSMRAQALAGRWSAVGVLRRTSAPDQLVLYAQWSGEPGSVWISQPIWDDVAGELKSEPDRHPDAQLVTVGSHATLADAQGSSLAACLPGSVLLSTDVYAGIEPHRYVHAVVSTDRRLAEAALKSAKACAGAAPAALVPLRLRWTAIAEYPVSKEAWAKVGFGAYDGDGWPLEVELVDPRRVLARLALPWPVRTPTASAAVDVDLPVGDPLLPWRGQRGWALGDGDAPALMAIRRLRMGPDQQALLWSMEAGFEHRKRTHALVMAHAGRLRTGWLASDPEGPSWSTVLIRPSGVAADELIHFAFFESSEAGELDRVQVSQVSWDPRTEEFAVRDVGCDQGVSLVVLRAFGKLEQALAAKDAPCAAAASTADADVGVPRPLVLEAPRGSGVHGYVLAHVSADAAAVRRVVSQATRCWPGVHPRVLSWCGQAMGGGGT